MSLIKLYFKLKVIKFTNDFMYNYNLSMLREKNQSTNVLPNDKWIFCNSISLCHIINMSSCHLFGTWHAIIQGFFPQRRKSIHLKLYVYHILARHSRIRLTSVYLINFILKHQYKSYKNTKTIQYSCRCSDCVL